MSLLNLQQALVRDGQLTISVRVRVNAQLNQIVAFLSDGTLKVDLAAPPTDNRANQALLKLIAQSFELPTTQVKIISGQTGRFKLIKLIAS